MKPGQRGEGRIKAIAYLPSAAAGAKNAATRRRSDTIARYADATGHWIVDAFRDRSPSGTGPLAVRPGFWAMTRQAIQRDVRVIFVETVRDFAVDPLTQAVIRARLRDLGMSVIAADPERDLAWEAPIAASVREVLGAMSEIEQTMRLAKLQAARDRKSAKLGRRVEGRKPHALMTPDAVALAKRLHRKSPNSGKRCSLRVISAELAKAGYFNSHGRPYHPQSISDMLTV